MSGGKGEGPGDYDVGRGKPPEHSRFKPGQSGNPQGRPKRARGKHQQLLEAMDQPTREIFIAEMYREITITSGREEVTMPTIQMITRRMAKSAAEGGQQAQRTAIMLQLELEREEATNYAALVKVYREVKEQGGELFAWCRERALQEPDILPHPDDIIIDEQSQRIEILGPSTPEQKATLDKFLAERDGYQRGVIGLGAEAEDKPRDWMLPILAVMAQQRFDLINDRLPERYRKKLEGRLTVGQIEAAQQWARKVFAARERRRVRRVGGVKRTRTGSSGGGASGPKTAAAGDG